MVYIKMDINDYTVVISAWYEDSPIYWKNFISELCGQREIEVNLKKYNAVIQFIDNDWLGNDSILVFDTPADKTLFILKWS